jgi:hypothetical protein
MKNAIALSMLLLLFLASAVPAQQKTDVNDRSAAQMLLGRHKLSLQWVSWDYFGVATVKNSRGMYTIAGEQKGRGMSKGNSVTIDGVITSIDAKEFRFLGKIVTLVTHINGGKPCERDGEFTFMITGKRRYWRLQEMDSPCDQATDYVDVYFR